MSNTPEKSKVRKSLDANPNRFGCKRKTEQMDLAPVVVSEGESDAVLMTAQSMGLAAKGIDDLAEGAFKAIASENGEVTDRGRRRVACAVKFIGGLLGGKKHKNALEESGMVWSQVSSFILACPEFERMYNIARGQMKMAMGMTVLDAAFEMATEGSDVYYKGTVVGKKKSEKMLDKLLTLSGKEFSKEGKGGNNSIEGVGGITLNFHFDGKKQNAKVETVDV